MYSPTNVVRPKKPPRRPSDWNQRGGWSSYAGKCCSSGKDAEAQRNRGNIFHHQLSISIDHIWHWEMVGRELSQILGGQKGDSWAIVSITSKLFYLNIFFHFVKHLHDLENNGFIIGAWKQIEIYANLLYDTFFCLLMLNNFNKVEITKWISSSNSSFGSVCQQECPLKNPNSMLKSAGLACVNISAYWE